MPDFNSTLMTLNQIYSIQLYKSIYRGFQPENLMFSTRKSKDLKLIDFGLASRLDPDHAVKVSTATADFAAPEVVDHEPVGFYSDMWSVGVLSYIL